MDTISLSEYATEIEGETITGIENLSLEEPRTTERQRCVDCNKRHIPRRFVYCVDGTWMVEDGPEGCFENNPSNVFRVYLSVKEGRVVGNDGKEWEQRKGYYRGLGARQPKWKKYWQGGSGDGYEELIAEVYEHCAKACCPSQDELFLFGYSRGAFVVRAVAGLFNGLGTLKRGTEGWDDKLAEGIDRYKRRTEEENGNCQPYSDFHFLSRYTTCSPRIQFLGLFDTVKSVGFLNPGGSFSWLNNTVTRPLFQDYHYDIRQASNTYHVRHALALLENRDTFKPERVHNEQRVKLPTKNASRTCLEAWFLGFHADIGGGLKEDGLSLWPLQWILSEAAHYGLFLEFQAPERLVKDIQDPIENAMPGEDHHIPFKNGATVRMWDLNEKFNRPNLQPAANGPSGLTAQLSTSERRISTDEEGTAATIIHPSVFWADDMTPLGIRLLNPLTCANTIRQAIKDINIRPESLYWNLHHTRVVDLERSRPRVLICGPSGVGKSTLVNEVLGEEVSLASSGLGSVQHDIDTELSSTGQAVDGGSFTFHDANGFERGLEETLRRAHSFIKKRQESTTFKEQLHCIWYCCSSVARIEEADREFIRSISSCGIPFILVFTKYDFLRRDCLRDACRLYRKDHPDQSSFQPHRIPVGVEGDVESRRDSILDSRREERRDLVNELSTGQCQICFVTIEDEDTIQDLCDMTQASLKDELLLGIHDKAMRRYLDQALPQATRKFAELVDRNTSWSWSETQPSREKCAALFEDLRERLEAILPQIYPLNVAETLNSNDTLSLFAELDRVNGAASWWTRWPRSNMQLAITATTVLIQGAGIISNALNGKSNEPPDSLLAFVMSGESPKTGSFLMDWLWHTQRSQFKDWELLMDSLSILWDITMRGENMSVDVVRGLAAQAACAILIYEKLFWLGIKDVHSREILARVAIEVLKQSEEIIGFLKRAKIRSVAEFEDTLQKLVVEMRTNLGLVAE